MSSSRLQQILADQHNGSPGNLIVRTMSERGAISAADIARETGLARSTISTALSELKKSGIVVENSDEPRVVKGAGRPATSLTLNPEAGTCVGIHLSIEDIRLCIADVSHSVIDEQIINLGPDYLPETAAAAARKAMQSLYRSNGLSRAGLLGVGVSVSGPISPDGQLQRASILPTWAGINITELFSAALNCLVFTDNESNCAAIAEMMWGAAVGYDDFVIFKIDLGVGGAVVNNGRVITGIAGGAGEFGHISLEGGSALCRCGNRGCLELSAGFKTPIEQASKIHNRAMTMDDVILLAEEGDIGALRLINDSGEAAGRGLALICTIINPPLVIIGGRMALAGDIILEPLKKAFEKHIMIKSCDLDEASRTRIVVGKYTENDSLLGAVGLVLRSHGKLAHRAGA
jgi:predicted NBD/HSP70 family sugar kinase